MYVERNCFPFLCVCIFVILNFCEISPIKLAHSDLYNCYCSVIDAIQQ